MVWLDQRFPFVPQPLAHSGLADHRASGFFAQMRRRRGRNAIQGGSRPTRVPNHEVVNARLSIPLAKVQEAQQVQLLPAKSVQFMRWRRVGNARSNDRSCVHVVVVRDWKSQQVRLLPTAFLQDMNVPTQRAEQPTGALGLFTRISRVITTQLSRHGRHQLAGIRAQSNRCRRLEIIRHGIGHFGADPANSPDGRQVKVAGLNQYCGLCVERLYGSSGNCFSHNLALSNRVNAHFTDMGEWHGA